MYDFSFLADNIDRQRELALIALDQAKKIDAQIQILPEGIAKEELKIAKTQLVDLARSISNNANSTSIIATAVIRSCLANHLF